MKIIKSAEDVRKEKEAHTKSCTCPDCNTYSPIHFEREERKRVGLFKENVRKVIRHRCIKCGCIWEETV